MDHYPAAIMILQSQLEKHLVTLYSIIRELRKSFMFTSRRLDKLCVGRRRANAYHIFFDAANFSIFILHMLLTHCLFFTFFNFFLAFFLASLLGILDIVVARLFRL